VSKVVLATNDNLEVGKYKGLTGKDVETLPVEEQKNYVLKDAELVMQLSKHNNSEVLDVIKSISEITGLATASASDDGNLSFKLFHDFLLMLVGFKFARVERHTSAITTVNQVF
jgi:predicted esterase YcpF (UPF0227 family)